jgi:hypothetical protein
MLLADRPYGAPALPDKLGGVEADTKVGRIVWLERHDEVVERGVLEGPGG